MPRDVNEIIKKLSCAERKRVEKRAKALIAEKMTLRQLRRARKLTQVAIRLDKAFGGGVSD